MFALCCRVAQRYHMYMRMYMPDDHQGAIMHHYRCGRRLVSRGTTFPMTAADWINETVVVCPDALDNSTQGGGARRTVTNGIGGPVPVDFYGVTPFSVPGEDPKTLLMFV